MASSNSRPALAIETNRKISKKKMHNFWNMWSRSGTIFSQLQLDDIFWGVKVTICAELRLLHLSILSSMAALNSCGHVEWWLRTAVLTGIPESSSDSISRVWIVASIFWKLYRFIFYWMIFVARWTVTLADCAVLWAGVGGLHGLLHRRSDFMPLRHREWFDLNNFSYRHILHAGGQHQLNEIFL
jgi:hypothetical protein